jgi:hypothetical protein
MTKQEVVLEAGPCTKDWGKSEEENGSWEIPIKLLRGPILWWK